MKWIVAMPLTSTPVGSAPARGGAAAPPRPTEPPSNDRVGIDIDRFNVHWANMAKNVFSGDHPHDGMRCPGAQPKQQNPVVVEALQRATIAGRPLPQDV